MTDTIVDQNVYTKEMNIVTKPGPEELTFEEGAQTTCQF